MATVTKRDLVIKISNESGLTQQQVFTVLQELLDAVNASLAAGDEVVLRNFGSFQVRVTKAKVGRNPNQPGSDVAIPPRAVVKFKPGKELKEGVLKLSPGGAGEAKIKSPKPAKKAAKSAKVAKVAKKKAGVS